MAHDSVEDEVVSSSRPGLRSLAQPYAGACGLFDFNVRPLLHLTALADSRLTTAQIRVHAELLGKPVERSLFKGSMPDTASSSERKSDTSGLIKELWQSGVWKLFPLLLLYITGQR